MAHAKEGSSVSEKKVSLLEGFKAVQETLEVSELEVLKEIRDALVSQPGGPAVVPPGPPEGSAQDGALIVLSVPRDTATALAGAGISSQLAVTLC